MKHHSAPNGKIFAIGFNKCGTTSLTHLFSSSGYKSSHNNYKTWYGRNINLAARIFENRAANRKLLSGVDKSTFYSDMELNDTTQNLSAFLLFQELDQQYPNSRFILNLRDKENWIRSRSNHRNGQYLKKYMSSANVETEAEVQEIWSKQWDEHISNVREYFKAFPEKLVEFNIEKDNVTKLLDFFSDLSLDPTQWGVHNKNARIHAPSGS